LNFLEIKSQAIWPPAPQAGASTNSATCANFSLQI